MTTSLQGTGLDLTPDVRRLVDDKLAAALRPLGSGDHPAAHAAVELERTASGPYRAEVTLTLGRSTLRVEATADTLVQALVEAKHALTRRVRDWRRRRRDAQRTPVASPAAPAEHDDEDDEA